MKLGLLNQGNLSGGYRHRLGAAPTQVDLSVTPDSIPPEQVPFMPVSTAEANEARLKYTLSAKSLEGEAARLENTRPADWDERVYEAYKYSRGQYETLVSQVRGRTGNSHAEYELELQWWGLWEKAHLMSKNAPSALEKGIDALARLFEDFRQGSQAAWQGYSEWAVANSGPILRDYYDSLVYVAELKANLEVARSSGEYSAGQLLNQEQAVARAEESLQSVRNAYKAVSSGGDIDKVAIEEYGSGSMGGPIYLIIAVVVIYYVVKAAKETVKSISKMGDAVSGAVEDVSKAIGKFFKDNPAGALLTVGAIAAMMVLPFTIFRSKDERKVLTAPQPEVR